MFNSKDADGFDNPPIELGSSVLNAMTRLDFGSVEAITSANQQALEAMTDPAQVELNIKAIVEESRDETGNDPASSDYQQLVECAKLFSMQFHQQQMKRVGSHINHRCLLGMCHCHFFGWANIESFLKVLF
jgi:hypothetical protein